MDVEIKEYPCKVKVGNKIRIKGGDIKTVEAVDGRYIYFTDGSQFGLRHPDLEGVVVEHKKKKKQEPQEQEEKPSEQEEEEVG